MTRVYPHCAPPYKIQNTQSPVMLCTMPACGRQVPCYLWPSFKGVNDATS